MERVVAGEIVSGWARRLTSLLSWGLARKLTTLRAEIIKASLVAGFRPGRKGLLRTVNLPNDFRTFLWGKPNLPGIDACIGATLANCLSRPSPHHLGNLERTGHILGQRTHRSIETVSFCLFACTSTHSLG